MWERFKWRLGKFVQDVKAIFRRRGNSTTAQEKEFKLEDYNEITENPIFSFHTNPWEVTFTCDNTKINKDMLDSLCNSTEIEKAKNEVSSYAYQLLDNADIDKLIEEALELCNKNPKFLVNWSRTNLPKRIKTKALIISVAANQPYEYVAVDLSQLEETGIAHFIQGIKESHQEKWEVEKKYATEEDAAEVEEYLRQFGNDNELISSIVPGATLLHYEDLDLWDYEE